MPLTLGLARASLSASCVPPTKLSTAALAAPFVNMATSWIINEGKWRGTLQRVVFAVNDDQFTLPRGLGVALGAVVQGEDDNFRLQYPYRINNEFFEFLSGGTGLIADPPCQTTAFHDRGDGFVTFRDLPSAGTVKVTTTTTETAGEFHVRGLSGGTKTFTGTGEERIEGENITLPTASGASSTSATTFDEGASLYSIVKPLTNGVLLFYHVASSDATNTLIGRFDPGEQLPRYRRYLVPKRINDEGQVVALCKVQHVEAIVDNDEIFPGNLNALEMALTALNYRRKDELERASQYFQMAIAALNSELTEHVAEQSWGSVQIDPGQSFAHVANLL